VSYEDSAVSDRVRNVRIFDNDRVGVSAGARLQMEREAHARPVLRALFHQGRAGGSLARQPLLCGRGLCREAKPSVDVAALGITYRWDTPARAEPAPVIRKY
jgi:hypothetical protein